MFEKISNFTMTIISAVQPASTGKKGAGSAKGVAGKGSASKSSLINGCSYNASYIHYVRMHVAVDYIFQLQVSLFTLKFVYKIF